MGYQSEAWAIKGIKMYKLPVIQYVSHGDVQHREYSQ